MSDALFSLDDITRGGAAGATAAHAAAPAGGLYAINTVLSQLRQAWINERVAPELLPFETAAYEHVRGQLESQRKALDARGADREGTAAAFKHLYEMDLDRLRYLLAAYTRVRLAKIQQLYMWLSARPAVVTSVLSPDEARFLAEYSRLRQRHLWSTVLSHIADDGGGGSSARAARRAEAVDADLAADARSSRLPLDRHVFVRVLDDIGAVRAASGADEDDGDTGGDTDLMDAVASADGEPIDLQRGHGIIVAYRVVRPYVKSGRVALS